MEAPVMTQVTGNHWFALGFWTHPGGEGVTFNLYFKRAVDEAWSAGQTYAPSSPAVYYGLVPETPYEFRVTAVQGGVESAPSNVIAFTTPAKPNTD